MLNYFPDNLIPIDRKPLTRQAKIGSLLAVVALSVSSLAILAPRVSAQTVPNNPQITCKKEGNLTTGGNVITVYTPGPHLIAVNVTGEPITSTVNGIRVPTSYFHTIIQGFYKDQDGKDDQVVDMEAGNTAYFDFPGDKVSAAFNAEVFDDSVGTWCNVVDKDQNAALTVSNRVASRSYMPFVDEQ